MRTSHKNDSRRAFVSLVLGVFVLAVTIHQSHGLCNPHRTPRSAMTLTTSPHHPHSGSVTANLPFLLQQRQSGKPLYMAMQEEDEEAKTFSSPLDRPIVAAVDFLALLIFAGVGKASHAADGSIDILAVLSVAFPFVLSWFVTSPLTGVYETSTRNKNSPLLNEAKTAAKGWIVAIPLGIALRGVIKGYVPPIPFVIVTMIATLVILCASRVAFSVMEDFFVELVN